MTAKLAVETIRKLSLRLGQIDHIRAYMETSLELSGRRASLRSEMQAGGVTIVDTPHAGGKDGKLNELENSNSI